MAGPVSFVHTNFTGGEISQSAQGAMDLPAYKISMNICLNWVPQETGSLQRRPGTRHVAPTRGGLTGKLISFAFEDSFPYQMEFTDGYLRFTTGPALVMTNDQQAVVAISTANPAVVHTAGVHGYSNSDCIAFNSLGANNPLLQNRQFFIGVVDATHFNIVDSVTGANIDGSTLGSFVSGNVTRVLQIVTIYTTGSWSNLRSVQAETRTVLLNGAHPQVLQVATPPTTTKFATFTLGPADFLDGPYLDPVAGSIANINGLNGVIAITLTFQAYDPTVAYTIGAFVTETGQGYKSLISPNQGNNPATSPAQWAPVNGGAPINNGSGFVSSDIGRLVRLFSEPALWSLSATYATGNVVAYPDGSGGFSYWNATGNIPANGPVPGTSTLWALNATGAQWTWAQITAVSGSGLINPANAFGTLGGGGGLASAFDGNTSKAFASAANFSVPITTYPVWGVARWAQGSLCQYNGIAYQANLLIVSSDGNPQWSSGTVYNSGQSVQYGSLVYTARTSNSGIPPNTSPGAWSLIAAIDPFPPPTSSSNWNSLGALPSGSIDVYLGQSYGSGQTILSATVWPTSDQGFANDQPITLNLRGKNTAPANGADGTMLASTTIGNTFAPVTLASNNTTSTWNYIWVEVIVSFAQPLPVQGPNTFNAIIGISQVQFYSPNVQQWLGRDGSRAK